MSKPTELYIKAYKEALRAWLNYKNYNGDKRKRIYLLLQERADSAREFLWNTHESLPCLTKLADWYYDEDMTKYEDYIMRIFGKLEGTTEHDNAYYRARIAAIRRRTSTQDVQVQKWLGCGYIPERLREDFNIFIKQELRNDNSQLTFTELMTYNTWYELHPEKVAGTMVGSSSFYFPVIVKGSKNDVENMFKAALKKGEVYKEGETYFSADNEIYFTILAVGNGKILIQPSTTKKTSWVSVASIDKLVEKGWHRDDNGKISSDKSTKSPKYKIGDKFTDKGGSVFTITKIRSYDELNDYEKGIAKKRKAQFFYYLDDGHQTVACWDANIEELFEPIKDEDDNDDELELLELEAEALALELEISK